MQNQLVPCVFQKIRGISALALAAAAAFAAGTTAHATITGSSWAMNGGIICDYPLWDNNGTVWIHGNQSGAAQLLGTITTDTPDDPTLILSTSLNNDTGSAWTGYHISIYLNAAFTLSSVGVTLPNDWSAAYNPNSTYDSGLGLYVDTIDFTAGTAVLPGYQFNYTYSISFSGATSFSLTQSVTPVPEPGSAGLVLIGGLALVGCAIAKRRHAGITRCASSRV